MQYKSYVQMIGKNPLGFEMTISKLKKIRNTAKS